METALNNNQETRKIQKLFQLLNIFKRIMHNGVQSNSCRVHALHISHKITKGGFFFDLASSIYEIKTTIRIK